MAIEVNESLLLQCETLPRITESLQEYSHLSLMPCYEVVVWSNFLVFHIPCVKFMVLTIPYGTILLIHDFLRRCFFATWKEHSTKPI